MGDANSSYEKNQLKGEQEAHDQRAERPDFSEFTEDDWVRWINSFLNAELSDPIVRVGHQEPHQVLARIYSTLGDKSLQDRFGEAVARILESTPPIESNSSHLYFIIELISLVRPHRGKRLLRRYLRERSLLEFEFGLRNLHSMLLVAASKYDVDRGLVEIIKRSRPYIQDFTYRLICLRVLSLREDPDEYLQYLSDLLPELDSNAKAVALARQLKGVFFRHGHDRFCEWYSKTARDPTVAAKNYFDFFEGAIKQLIFSTAELDVDVEGDPSRTLVAAQLQAYDSEGRVDAQTVLLLARLSETAGENIAINALVNVWRRRIPFAPEGMPWWYLPPSPKSKWVRTGGNPNLALLITDPNSTTETSVHFQTDDEPMVAYVLERVKSACETRVVFEKIPHEIGAGTPLVKAAYVSPGALHPALELILEDSD